MKRFTHAVVVGGSGMLAELSRNLLDISEQVTVMARNESRVRAIARGIQPFICDYTDEVAFNTALSSLEKPDLVVAWLHGKLPAQRRALAHCLHPKGCLIQVLGSAHGDPSRPDRLEAMRAAADGLGIAYQAVVLGYVVEGKTSRWLTDRDISQGVFSAVQSGASLSIVGTVSPWEARP
jgi:hypothetical protein